MKCVTFASFSVLIAFSQLIVTSWLTIMPIVLISLSKPAEGFFGIFRRRQPVEPPVIKETQNSFMSSFPPQGSNFFNPFGGSGSGGFFPGSQRPSFPGGFPSFPGFSGGFMSPPWGQGMPQISRGQMSQFNQIPSRNQLPVPSMSTQQSLKFQSSPPDNFESKENNVALPDFGSDDLNSDQNEDFDSQNMEHNDLESKQEVDSQDFDDTPPPINTEEAESFFTLLAETDENKCISRLVCEMGADPDTAGDLGRTVNDIIGSLTDFPPGSRVSDYNEILKKGRSRGMAACVAEYPMCDEETYNLMKSSQPEE